jgi:hypothetical protein
MTHGRPRRTARRPKSPRISICRDIGHGSKHVRLGTWNADPYRISPRLPATVRYIPLARVSFAVSPQTPECRRYSAISNGKHYAREVIEKAIDDLGRFFRRHEIQQIDAMFGPRRACRSRSGVRPTTFGRARLAGIEPAPARAECAGLAQEWTRSPSRADRRDEVLAGRPEADSAIAAYAVVGVSHKSILGASYHKSARPTRSYGDLCRRLPSPPRVTDRLFGKRSEETLLLECSAIPSAGIRIKTIQEQKPDHPCGKRPRTSK